MRQLLIIPYVILALFMVQCKSGKAPVDADTMENILYDYYLSSAISQAGQSSSRDSMSYVMQSCFNAALHKYGVTKEVFDEALLYYQRHTAEYKEIRDNINERLINETGGEDALELQDKYAMLTEKGDSAKIWNGASSILLYAKPPLCRSDFSIKCDTALHPGDQVELYFNSMIIAQEGSRDLAVLVAVEYDNDSIGQVLRHVSSNGKNEMRVTTDKNHQARRIYGFFTLQQMTTDAQSTIRTAYVNSIGMVRLRQKTINENKETNEKDTPSGMPPARVAPPALKPDSAMRRVK